jgi:ATP-dependent helicase Lhr and Lhr-like helicase
VQALLDAPLFGVRWRWNATTALALPRFVGGSKVAPQLQRMRSEDLLASVFPDQVACLENIVGEREIPDHPLVAQTLDDCLHEAMDAEGWLQVLRAIEANEIEVVARDLTTPSPLAAEALNAKTYAFLDDAPLEERRTQAVMARRYVEAESADDLGRLDPEAIASVREQAWPEPRDHEEMHEALLGLGLVAAADVAAQPAWADWLQALARARRATQLRLADGPGPWVCAERLPQAQAAYGLAAAEARDTLSPPPIEAPPDHACVAWTAEDATAELLRGRLSGLGVTDVPALADSLRLPADAIAFALARLESEGQAMRGRFSPAALAGGPEEWCERHLLARIHRYTVGRLRREIEPVEPRHFLRFLADWQRVNPAQQARGADGLAAVLEQLEGFEAPASAWEDLLRARVADYESAWLDDLCTSGRLAWARLRARTIAPVNAEPARATGSLHATPIVLLPRRRQAAWSRLVARAGEDEAPLGSRAQKVADVLAAQGACFFEDLEQDARLLRPELEDALAELVSRGRVHCDSFAGLRALLVPPSKRAGSHSRRGRTRIAHDLQDAGRWTLTARHPIPTDPDPEWIEHVARVLLRRWGVVCYRLMEREPAWLPPWRELLRVYQRLEARGEIRGGRFIAGLSGEQFALPEAIAPLRKARAAGADGLVLELAAADPLNLLGLLQPGARVPRLSTLGLRLRDGLLEPIDAEALPLAALG